MVLNGEISTLKPRRLTEQMMKRQKETPVVIYGLIPPYYPVASSAKKIAIELLKN